MQDVSKTIQTYWFQTARLIASLSAGPLGHASIAAIKALKNLTKGAMASIVVLHLMDTT